MTGCLTIGFPKNTPIFAEAPVALHDLGSEGAFHGEPSWRVA